MISRGHLLMEVQHHAALLGWVGVWVWVLWMDHRVQQPGRQVGGGVVCGSEATPMGEWERKELKEGRVALRPCGQVAPRGVLLLLLLLLLLLALRVAATTVVRRPAGAALLRVAQPSSAGGHQAPVANSVAAAVASNVAAHAEMIEAGPRPRPGPRGVHGRGGRWGMDVGWREKRARASLFDRFYR
ncbi:hypothetical protein EYF80_007861 [Liparis tanakae]|uniref:Uncharacterized protein n=1 Tax=Liparis tanakae TaxID=230148 RepID=A0A4Z2IXH4_9TELE|nr:hypothetical protein EYF80_007861 [Liparis tanakae]